MTRNEIRALVALRLGNRTDLDSRIDAELLLVQNDLEQEDFLPWFLVKRFTTLQTDAVSTDTADLTDITDFILPYEEADFDWYNTDSAEWVPMRKRVDVREQQYADSRVFATATPGIFTFVGNNLILYPDPGKQVTIRGWYYGNDVALTSDIENNWTKFAPEVVASLCCVKVAPTLQYSADQVQVYATMYSTALARLRRLDEARRVSATNETMQYGGGIT